MKAALLLALCCMGCATARQAATPEIPRIRCLNIGHIPKTTYWLYACEFRGDTVPPVLDDPGSFLGG